MEKIKSKFASMRIFLGEKYIKEFGEIKDVEHFKKWMREQESFGTKITNSPPQGEGILK